MTNLITELENPEEFLELEAQKMAEQMGLRIDGAEALTDKKRDSVVLKVWAREGTPDGTVKYGFELDTAMRDNDIEKTRGALLFKLYDLRKEIVRHYDDYGIAYDGSLDIPTH